VTYASDQNLGWAAQKPVDLYRDFLMRSCRAGDSVLDPFCGSGTIFAAAHGLKVKATGIEVDRIAYGISVMRLGELK
jgi:DNA modification methylase